MNRIQSWVILACWVLMATAQAADAPSVKPLFSLAPGNKWVYEETQDSMQVSGSRTNVAHVAGTVSEETLPAPAHYKELGDTTLLRSTAKEQRDAGGTLTDVSGGYVQLWEWRRDDLYLHGVRVWIDGSYSESMNLYQPPLPYLKRAARAGEKWTVGTQKYMGVELATTATLLDLETVTVPAGTFSNCIKVVYTSTKKSVATEISEQPPIEHGTLQDTIWYAPDVGVVKETQLSLTTYWVKDTQVFDREEQNKLLKSHTPAK